MTWFVLSRAGQALLALFVLSLAAFVLIHLTPGDPAQLILGLRATPSAIATLRHELGLDQALPSQYWNFVKGAVQLDFGESLTKHAPVSTVLGPNVSATLLLMAYATLISVVVGIPLGVISATKKNRLADHAIRLFTMTTFAMPPFWLGLLLILIFGVQLGILPTSGYGDSFAGHIESLTLPALTLGLAVAPLVVRTLRSSLIETLGAEFVEAARMRGMSARRVLWRYGLRNSLIATVTILGVNIGVLTSHIVVVENVFDVPGLGTLLVQSVAGRDYPVVQALVLVLGAIIVVVSFLTDLMYAAVDPRVRL